MRDWITTAAACAGIALVPVTLGISSCESQEVCDGIDNDGDGEVDEDFDQDGDGYQDSRQCSSGTDCNDYASSIHPNANEPVDGIDNDCDGQVDEAQERYTVYFEERYSGVPLPGVPVWIGLDGTGPLVFSGEDGRVDLYLENPVADWSFAYSYSTSYREYRRIYSYLDDTLEADQTFRLHNPELEGERRDMTGTITGVDPTVESAVYCFLRPPLSAMVNAAPSANAAGKVMNIASCQARNASYSACVCGVPTLPT